MPIKIKKPIDKYMELPEGYPVELIGGELLMTPSPSYSHQKIAGELFRKVASYVEQKSLGEVLYVFDIRLDDDNVVRPDIIFIPNEDRDKIRENWVEGAPSLVIEVLSSSTATRDLVDKRELYERHGVREYWVVDPENSMLYIFENNNGVFRIYCKGKRCQSKLLKGLEWVFE